MTPAGPTAETLGGRLLAAAVDLDAGRFDRAVARARTVTEQEGDLGAAAHLLQASACRQRGLHQRAEPHDQAAWSAAVRTEIRAAAAAGLAADGVGRGDGRAAQQWWERAKRILADSQADPDRSGEGALLAEVTLPAVTVAWVETEVALLHGRAGAAVAAGLRACELAESRPALRRAAFVTAKSLLFLGVAEHVAGSADAEEHLHRALRLATDAGLDPLIAAIAGFLADTGAEHSEALRATAAAAAARMAGADAIAEDPAEDPVDR